MQWLHVMHVCFMNAHDDGTSPQDLMNVYDDGCSEWLYMITVNDGFT